MKKAILKTIFGLVAFVLVVYVVTSLVLNCWNPKNWVAAANTLYTSEPNTTPSETEPGNNEPGSDQPAAPTSPDSSPDTSPDTPLTSEALSYINAVNAALDALDANNFDSDNFNSISVNFAKLSEIDLTKSEVIAAREAGSLIQDNIIIDGYWWLSLELRQAAAQIMIDAGLRTDMPTEDFPKPSIPLTPEALKYIDAVNDALDSKDIKQYQLLSIISCYQNLRESDLTRKEVVAAREAGSLIVKNAVLESGITYSLPLDARLAAAQIMIAAGLRTEISWVH